MIYVIQSKDFSLTSNPSKKFILNKNGNAPQLFKTIEFWYKFFNCFILQSIKMARKNILVSKFCFKCKKIQLQSGTLIVM